MTDKEYKIRFAPGAFDNFEGTQEELNDLVAEIKNMAINGDLIENSHPVDMDLLEQENPELYQTLTNQLEKINRKLN